MANVGKYTIDTCIPSDIASVAILHHASNFTTNSWLWSYGAASYMEKTSLVIFRSCWFKKKMEQHNLAGGWTNPFEKNMLFKLDHIPRVRGGNTKIFELPPPSNSNNSIWTNITSRLAEKNLSNPYCFAVFFRWVAFRQARLARLINGILCSQP